jgi:hypothetical protein
MYRSTRVIPRLGKFSVSFDDVFLNRQENRVFPSYEAHPISRLVLSAL